MADKGTEGGDPQCRPGSPRHRHLMGLGYVMRKTDYESAPLVLAFILTPSFEDSFRQALLISHGDFMVFLNRPVALLFLIVAMGLLTMPLLGHFRKGVGKVRAAARE